MTLQRDAERRRVTDRFGRHRSASSAFAAAAASNTSGADPASAVVHAVGETWNLSTSTLGAMWQMVTGKRSADELGGPLRIAQLSGEVAQIGIGAAALVHGGAVDQSRADQPVPGAGA